MAARVLRDIEWERSFLEEGCRLAQVPAGSTFVDQVMSGLAARGPDLPVWPPEAWLGTLERQAIDMAATAAIACQALAAQAMEAEDAEQLAGLMSLMRALVVAAAGVAELIDPSPEA